MKLSYVCIENFRNFKKCEVCLGQNIVLVGENKAGKSNFITALRLVLDPIQNRQLTNDDFWDGDGEPHDGRSIKVTVRITDFGDDRNPEIPPLVWLSDCLIEKNPPTAQLTYLYYLDSDKENSEVQAQLKGDNCKKEDHEAQNEFQASDYKWIIYPGEDNQRTISLSGMWQDMPLDFISAIRDIASDGNVWSKSPLNELIKQTDDIDVKKLQPYSSEVGNISDRMVKELFKNLEEGIRDRLLRMVGKLYAVDPKLGLNTVSPETMIKALRIFVDGDRNRPITRTSLGLQNAIHLSLLSLQLDQKQQHRNGKNKSYLPIVALEEPEAHLHPHLQRLVFKDFLKSAKARKLPVIISSHSPHLVTASEIIDLVHLKDCASNGTLAFSASDFIGNLSQRKQRDLERFLDITKSEMLFSKAVLFVEGDVEVLLMDTFMTVIGIDLDEYGISVCNVYGTQFEHVITLAIEFSIPFAVLTDGDKFNQVTGLERGISLVKKFDKKFTKAKRLTNHLTQKRFKEVRKELAYKGIFVNEWTLEPELIKAGLAEELKLTFQELGDELGENVRAGAQHIDNYQTNPNDPNMEKILSSISDTRWGKGRFAHRLCAYILNKAEETVDEQDKIRMVPAYIRDAIDYLIKQVIPKDDGLEEVQSDSLQQASPSVKS